MLYRKNLCDKHNIAWKYEQIVIFKIIFVSINWFEMGMREHHNKWFILTNALLIILWKATPDLWHSLKLTSSPYQSFPTVETSHAFHFFIVISIEKLWRSTFQPVQPVQTFISKILNSKYTGENLL